MKKAAAKKASKAKPKVKPKAKELKVKPKTESKAPKRRKSMAKSRASYMLNDKELKVWEAFPALGKDDEPKYLTLSELAGEAFPKKGTNPKSKPNSWVRNSMRKL